MMYYENVDKERIVSFSQRGNMEDVILYHILRDVDLVFYIDVGSNHPVYDSVTKLLYDTKGAHGINIEPQKNLWTITEKERERDINLCMGVGAESGTATFYVQGQLSTIVEENAQDGKCSVERIEMTTLAEICRQYVPKGQEITLLKVDVEGAEEAVLRGADFKKYRPWIIEVESTLPNSMVYCYEEWEPILLGQGYHFVYSYGVNRYYVADEKRELDSHFVSVAELYERYDIFTPDGELMNLSETKRQKKEWDVLGLMINNTAHQYEKHIICPFGNCGKKVKRILNEQYGITEMRILDNRLAGSEPNICTIDALKGMDTEKAVILLNAFDPDVNREILKQIMEIGAGIAIANVMDILEAYSEDSSV